MFTNVEMDENIIHVNVSNGIFVPGENVLQEHTQGSYIRSSNSCNSSCLWIICIMNLCKTFSMPKKVLNSIQYVCITYYTVYWITRLPSLH